MSKSRLVGCLLIVLALPTQGIAQDRRWVAEGSVGYAGFVDDATKHFVLGGGTVRRHVTPRLSIGPEFVIMTSNDGVRDRNVMLTGNVVFEATDAATPFVPYVIGGLGLFWGRDQVRGGPYWSRDPAFTAGAGIRAHITPGLSVAAEYRLGWELHQRVSAGAGIHW